MLLYSFMLIGVKLAFAGQEVSKIADTITVVGDVKTLIEKGIPTEPCDFVRFAPGYNALRLLLSETSLKHDTQRCEAALKDIALKGMGASGTASGMFPELAPIMGSISGVLGIISFLQDQGAAWCVCKDVKQYW